ncbi:MAG: serine hydrolase domain-containing protein [Ornithinimicrobium sp.]|uniref:serine hydrolase domain-containing protein n=1 Tax=Ornithinimicrobium sp. TaxID=1977084 RepID=UPI003D9B34D7
MTVRHLLAHTSGLADYFEGERADGGTTADLAFEHDLSWTLDDVLEITRGMRPAFAPDKPGKARYSDTNYQLLGAIVEGLTGLSFASAVAERIAAPLGLTQTYVFGSESLDRYAEIAPMLNGRVRLHIPHAMASFQADGGVVSTPCGDRLPGAPTPGRAFRGIGCRAVPRRGSGPGDQRHCQPGDQAVDALPADDQGRAGGGQDGVRSGVDSPTVTASGLILSSRGAA